MARSKAVANRRPSLHAVAAAADVSVSTVSRYLNGQLPLRAETEARVLSAMEELGYTQETRTVTAPSSRAGVIGLVVPQIGNTYFGRIADSVVTAAEAHGLGTLIVSTLSHSRKQLEYVELLSSKQVAGIVYAGNYSSNRALSSVIADGMPVVVIDEALVGAPPVDSVLVDDYAGAYQAVTYLLSLGHERIALVTGSLSLNSVQERTRGYRDALGRAGISADSQTHLTGAFSEEFGVGALSHLLASPEPPTAVFAASDTIALGMMTSAKTLGLSIPAQLSIVGFDDVPAAGFVSPRLTTVKTPVDKMAATAVSLLVERIEDPTRPVHSAVTSVALVVGDSTAPPSSK